MRFKKIKQVLLWILVLNWLVAFAKIITGILTGALSITADGFHSLFDGFTNIIGYLGIRLSERPADKDHPYGHMKYEAIASMLILFFLIIAAWEIVGGIYSKFFNPTIVNIEWYVFAVLAGCMVIDYFVARYEFKKSKELESTILESDSSHTKSHYITTGAVLLAAILIKLGLPYIVDPILTIIVVGFIVHLGYEIFQSTTQVLSDKAFVVDEDKVRQIIGQMSGIKSYHKIRTRGDRAHVFMDLHVIFSEKIPLGQAHEICNELEKRIKTEIPEVKDITIHPEPDSEASPS